MMLRKPTRAQNLSRSHRNSPWPAGASELFGAGGQFGGDQLKESSVQGGGVELDKCSRSKRASLEMIASSTAFSFLSCAQSLSIRSISFASALIRFSCKIFLRSYSIALISRSTTGRQLSIANQRRQRGKQERYADLLIKLDGAKSGELDMVVAGEQGDQGQQQASDNRDPARKVQTQHKYSQQRSSAIHPGASPRARQAWKYLIAVALASLND
jgi:hypothetical protein